MSQKKSHMISDQIISGRGGKSGASRTRFINSPNTIRSQSTLRMLSVVSAGPIEGLAKGEASLRVDGVPVVSPSDGSKNISGIKWSLIENGATDAADGINAVENIQAVNHQLRKNMPHTKSGQGDAARLILRLPHGLVRQTDQGVFGTHVEFKIEARLPDGSWKHIAQRRIAEKQSGFFEIQLQIEFRGIYSGASKPAVRLTRLTDEGHSTLSNRLDWHSITWIKRDRLSYAGLATLSLQLEAEAFQGRIPKIECDIKGRHVKVPANYTPKTRAYSGVWDGQFKMAYSNNPAWVIYDLLTDRDWGLGLAPALVEHFDLYSIARYADGLVSDGRGAREPRFLFDAVLSRRQSAFDLIQQICAPMRVMMFWSGGRLRFVQDRPADPVMWLTNNHVIDGQFIYTGNSTRHQISHALVSFIDPETSHSIAVEAESNPRILAERGYAAQEVAVLGCRRRSQARRHARWLLDKSDASLHSVSWRAGLDHFAANPVRPGDVVRIFDQSRHQSGHQSGQGSHKGGEHEQAPSQEGEYSGRLQVEAGQVRFDQPLKPGAYFLDYESTHGWQVNFAAQVASDGVTLTPRSVGAWPYAAVDQGAVVIKKERHLGSAHSGADYRVIAVRELDRHQLEIDAILHDNARFERIDANLSLASAPQHGRPDFAVPIAAPTNLRLEQPQAISGAPRLRDMLVSWTPPLDRRIAYWQVKAEGPDGESESKTVTASPAILSTLAVGAWKVSVAAVDWLGGSGKAAEATASVAADPSGASPPKSPSLTAEYGQLVLKWVRGNWPADAVVEVLEYRSAHSTTPLSVVASEGQAMILTGRTPGKRAYFTLRTRFKGGSLSAETSRLSGAALAWPKPKEVPVITSVLVTTKNWSDSQAVAAVRVLRGASSNPLTGDIVTQNRKAPNSSSPWSETRRFNGTAWVLAKGLMSGDVLSEQTVPASKLKLDSNSLGTSGAGDRLTLTHVPAGLITSGVLQSQNYASGQTGFKIDTSGEVEFNSAIIRGTLEGSRIKGSILVAPSIIIPCERYPTYFTREQMRPVVGQKTSYVGNSTVLGPLVIPSDLSSRRLGDANEKVLAVNDPHGASGGVNRYYSRFWSSAPLIIVTLDNSIWGAGSGRLAKNLKIFFAIKTKSGRLVDKTGVLDLSSAFDWLGSNGSGYHSDLMYWDHTFAPSGIDMTHEFKGSGSWRYTTRVTMRAELEFDCIHKASQPANDWLYVHVDIDFSGSSLTSSQQRSIRRGLLLECHT